MHRIRTGIAALAMLAGSISAAIAGVELKFAHAAPDTDLQQNLAVFFADEVAKRTGGEVTVKIFPQGQLGNDQQMISGARSGVVDIVMSGLNNFTGMMPRLGGLELPFMFQSREHAYKVLDGEIGRQGLAEFEQFGMKGLAYPENGYRNVTNNTHPIKTPADVAGLRMRTNNSVALNELFAMLKANPQQLPVAELYTALETGVVDAQEHPVNITYSFKFYEVQKYLSLTEHAYSALALAMNLDKFNALTSEQQKVVMEVAAEATAMQRKLSIEKQESILGELAAAGLEINRDVDKAAFQEAAKPTWDSYVAANGDELVKAVQAVK
ncbi:transporter [Mesorhizobium tianshanense]|uniref:Tripartite ATP-independent transporter DctP family solute receptor n=1 Tax=Mesorhizobium tianshanense TaxID=39844 RepID=A0A562MEX1_9HYPH|nr:DctP family TRAP transporter solute-binding subunit [Mesorhizobium tianshanense]TWI18450.1 tripartite ATP-independent transporter DctP family solute receptor [Mesorhizobium tianshanense]GLS41958.1 transporter [Mesorhizobium tianshanense]